MNKQNDKILFIGNSLTYWNDGLDYHIKNLVNLGELDFRVETESVVKSGANLKDLWEKTNARELIKSGKYNVVVLQEDIPETDINTFKEYVRNFNSECEDEKIRLILYMTWSYERLNWITIKEISDAHKEIARELNIEIAPVGLAWENVQLNRPKIELFDLDREHPSALGTYLATNVIFSTIYKMESIEYSYNHGKTIISNDDKEYLRNIAWQVVTKSNN